MKYQQQAALQLQRVAQSDFVAQMLALCCVFYVGIPVFSSGVIIRGLDFAAILIFLTTAPLCITTNAWREKGFLRWLAVFLITVFLSVVLVCIRNSNIHLDAWLKAIRFSYLLLFGYAAAFWKERQVKCFIKTLVWCGTGEAAFSVLMYLFQIERFCANQTFSKNGQLYYRASGFVTDAASFAFLCVTLIFISLFVLLHEKEKNIRAGAMMCFVLNWLGLWYSRTRVAVFAAFLVFLIEIILYKFPLDCGKDITKWMVKAIIAAGIFIGVSVVIGNLFFSETVCGWMDNLEAAIRSDGTVWRFLNRILSERLYIWAQYVSILMRTPFLQLLFGSGYYVFEQSMNVISYAAGEIMVGRPTHNMLLNTLVGMGLFGWFGLVGFVSSIIKMVISKGALIARPLLLCQLIFMLVDDSLSMVNSAAVLIVVAACVCYSADLKRVKD